MPQKKITGEQVSVAVEELSNVSASASDGDVFTFSDPAGIATVSFVGGSGYTNGTFTDIPLAGGNGTGAAATITVAGGAVTSVVVTDPGTGYVVGDQPLTDGGNLVGGTGFSATVLTLVPGQWINAAPAPSGPAQDTQMFRLQNDGTRVFDSTNYTTWSLTNPGSIIGGGYTQPNYVTPNFYNSQFEFQQSGTYVVTISRRVTANIQPSEDITYGVALSATNGASMLSFDQAVNYRPPPGFATNSNYQSMVAQWVLTSAGNISAPFGVFSIAAFAGAYINSSETYSDELWVFIRRVGDVIVGT